MRRAQLTPPRNIHLHNTPFTAALGRPIHLKLQGKKRGKKENCFPHTWEKFPAGDSLQESTANTSDPKATGDQSLSTSFKEVSTRSLLNSVKNETRGFTLLQNREKQGTTHRPQGSQLPGPCRFLHGDTDHGQTGLDYWLEPIQLLKRWWISIHTCRNGWAFINSLLPP